MEEILGKIKEQAGKAKDYAKKFGKTTVDKTNTVVSQTKLKLAISKTEDKIKEVYAEIGGKIYEGYAENLGAPDVKEQCEQIDGLYKEIEDLKQQLADISDTVKCDSCGASNNAKNVYCAKCGEKLNAETAKDIVEEAVEAVSEVVDAVIPED